MEQRLTRAAQRSVTKGGRPPVGFSQRLRDRCRRHFSVGLPTPRRSAGAPVRLATPGPAGPAAAAHVGGDTGAAGMRGPRLGVAHTTGALVGRAFADRREGTMSTDRLAIAIVG